MTFTRPMYMLQGIVQGREPSILLARYACIGVV